MESSCFGNGGFWGTPFEMMRVLDGTLITFIFIPSSTHWLRGCAIGRIRRFITTCSEACYRRIGAAIFLGATASVSREARPPDFAHAQSGLRPTSALQVSSSLLSLRSSLSPHGLARPHPV